MQKSLSQGCYNSNLRMVISTCEDLPLLKIRATEGRSFQVREVYSFYKKLVKTRKEVIN